MKYIYPRKKLDIRYRDLAKGFCYCCNPFLRSQRSIDTIRESYKSRYSVLPTSSVRSGFDLLLRCMPLKEDSEIVMTGISIADMFRIPSSHNLKIVPISLSRESLQLNLEEIEKKINSKTVALLVAHLFGAVVPLDILSDIKRKYPHLLIIEDVAQSFAGVEQYQGQSISDVVMFSFGTIKTHTSLGGAVMIIKNQQLARDMEHLYMSYPVAGRAQHMKNILKAFMLKGLTHKLSFTLLCHTLKLLKINPDNAIYSMTKGITGDDFFKLIRRRPSSALLALLSYRLRNFSLESFQKRAKRGEYLSRNLSDEIVQIGGGNQNHSYWLLPIEFGDTEGLIESLRDQGFDCAKNTTQLIEVSNTVSNGEKPEESRLNYIYLPVDPSIGLSFADKITRIVNSYGKQSHGQ